MSDTQVSNDSGNSSFGGNSDILIPHAARFWILLPPDIASTLCTFVTLIYIFKNQKARSNIKNHVLIILLLFGLAIQLIDVPFYLNFTVHSAVIPANPSVCQIWSFVDIGLYNGTIILMAWMSFERHILVFHDQWVSTRKKRIIIHYIPISSIILYVFIYYIYVIYFYPCKHDYDYASIYCGSSTCYTDDKILNWWDIFANSVIPSLLEPFITLSFLFRVIWQKHRSHQPMQWRKRRKMTIQLMGLAIPNFSLNFPLSVLYIAQLCGMPFYSESDVTSYMYFFCYFITFIFSFICLISIVDVKKVFLEKIFHRQRQPLTRFTVTVKPQGSRTIMATQIPLKNFKIQY
ncbi:unnamed protein product [Rotaria socialis]|uniref:G-protein coupled receptors family 1 profile domain-containing protein n=1 Tax=Rotaria socialis TaxID=392032 RepID=A0A820ZJ52_9BILA|nr:unnamed protein product [Rotaria socialis]CAF3779560.1 unnamed protein product [Rotaria socialis]CAF4564303.1 unnamed protein product [Rotaria socialis]CAF4894400.1 unnamed protein product [Rotaria socialis]